MKAFVRAGFASSIAIALMLVAPATQAQTFAKYAALSAQLKSIQLKIAQLPGVDASTNADSQVSLIMASVNSTGYTNPNGQTNRQIVNRQFAKAVDYVDEIYGPDASAAFEKAGQRVNRRLIERFGNDKAATIEKRFFRLVQKKFISPS